MFWMRYKHLVFSRKSLPLNCKVHTEATPNIDALKFVCPEHSTHFKSQGYSLMEFTNGSKNAPVFVQKILSINTVKSVFIGTDFITIEREKDKGIDWKSISPLVYEIMKNQVHLSNESQVIQEKSLSAESDNPNLYDKVQSILDSRIRPAVQGDGGDVEIVGLENGYVKLKLRGACRSCSSSTITLRNGIERMLMHYIEDVKGVIQFEDDVEKLADESFQEFETGRLQ